VRVEVHFVDARLAENRALGVKMLGVKIKLPARALILDVLARRDPRLLPIVEEAEPDRVDLDKINDVLTVELGERGFGADYTPTAYGRQIEDAIDEVNRVGS
jgi:hypothetical protein